MQHSDTVINFSTLLLSVSSTALASMGKLESDELGTMPYDLEFAKHNIDILIMLREKTKGNLTEEEDALVNSLIYDLQLIYVEQVKGKV